MPNIDIKKDNRRLAVGVFLRTIIIAVMNVLLYLSLMMLVTAVGTHRIGTDVYEVLHGDGTSVTVFYTHIPTTTATNPTTTVTQPPATTSPTEAGETTAEEATTSAAETTETTRDFREVAINSEVSPGFAKVGDAVAQILMLVMLISMPYSMLWAQGDKDANMVQFGHMSENRRRGLKIGFAAAIPSLIPSIGLILCIAELIPGEMLYLYKFLNTSFWPLMNLLTGGAKMANEVGSYSWLTVMVLSIVPFVITLACHIGYTLGYKRISITEKFIYVNPKKKRHRRR